MPHLSGENHPNWKGGVSKNYYRYKKIQKQRYPQHVKARQKAYDALRAGKLVKKPCEICGDTNVQMCHDDYSRPLDIRWLCPKCHRIIDKNKRGTGRAINKI